MALTGKLANLVAEIEARIETARLVSGQRLVEADLTRDFGVSRALLREAFRHLAADGAIELVPNKGAEVRRLSRSEALELFEIRGELEAMAARRAALRMGEASVRNAFSAATTSLLDGAVPQGALEYIAQNEAFHRAIFDAAGNQMLIDLVRRMRLSLIMSQLRDALTRDTLEVALDEHRQIAKAILDGTPERAVTQVRDHLIRAATVVAEAPERLFRPSR